MRLACAEGGRERWSVVSGAAPAWSLARKEGRLAHGSLLAEVTARGGGVLCGRRLLAGAFRGRPSCAGVCSSAGPFMRGVSARGAACLQGPFVRGIACLRRLFVRGGTARGVACSGCSDAGTFVRDTNTWGGAIGSRRRFARGVRRGGTLRVCGVRSAGPAADRRIAPHMRRTCATYATAPPASHPRRTRRAAAVRHNHFLYLKYQIVRAEQKIISPMAKR